MGYIKKVSLIEQKDTITPVVFVVDSSSGMAGANINRVMHAIELEVERAAALNRNELSSREFRIAVLQFSTTARWVTDGLENPADLRIPPIHCGGGAVFGSALRELNRKLHRRCFFRERGAYDTPIICFVSTGTPTGDFTASLQKLLDNPWYRRSHKVAVTIGADAGTAVLRQLVGDFGTIVPFPFDGDLGGILGQYYFFSPAAAAAPMASIPISPPGAPRPSKSHDNSTRPGLKRSAEVFYESAGVGYSQEIRSKETICPENKAQASALNWEEDFDSDHIAYSVAFDWGEDFCADASTISVKDSERQSVDACMDVGSDFSFMPGSTDTVFPPCSSAVPLEPVLVPSTPSAMCIDLGVSSSTKEQETADGVRPPVTVSQVQFSAVVPQKIIKGEYAMIDLSIYEDQYRWVIDQLIKNADDEVKEKIGSSQNVEENTKIRIVLTSKDLEVSDCDETQIWKGRYLVYSFPVVIPSNYAKKQALFVATVYFNGVIATRLSFIINCTSRRKQKLSIIREDVLSAFASYASKDKERVLLLIQGMKKVRPEMDIFIDFEGIRSGETWERVLKAEIERRDTLFLFWSVAASESEWVEKEWRYAMECNGLDSIDPVPLVQPDRCPPPEELKSKHFNDLALIYSNL